MPELPEVEITARLLDRALAGARVESALAPGINALRTFAPPLSALEGQRVAAVRRRGKHLIVEGDGGLALLIHLMSAGRLQQLATPAEIYARPANLFVAGFCGSPPMNLLDGTVTGGRFQRAEGSVPVEDGAASDGRILGFRPEHAQITMRGAADSFAGEIYVVELLGNETLVSVKAGDDRVNVRAAAGFQGQIGDECGVRPDASRTVLFNKDSGELVRGSTDGSSRQTRTGTVRESA